MRWTGLLVFGLLVNGCNAKAAEDEERTAASSTQAFEEHLVGRWTWVRSQGGWLDTTLTPETEEASYSVEYGPSGEYVERKDGRVLVSGRYRVEPGFAFNTGDRPVVVLRPDSSVFFWVFSPPEGQPIARLSSDTLVLFDEGSDGWLHVFARLEDSTTNTQRR